MPSITVDNRAAHYREWGSGKDVILLLHGWPADSSHFQQLGPLLAKEGYRVLAPDFPGWGKTAQPPQPWTVSDYRDWVHDLTEELSLTTYHLFGHSFGGRVAIKYAVKYATEVNQLILCASAGIKPDPFTLKRRILYLTAKTGKSILSLPLLSRFAGVAKKVLYRAAGSFDYLSAEGIMKQTIVKVLEEDLRALLPQVHQKTLLIWGDQDGATPLRDGELMHKLITDSKLVILDGEKHSLPKTAAEKVHHSLTGFLKSTAS